MLPTSAAPKVFLPRSSTTRSRRRLITVTTAVVAFLKRGSIRKW